VFSVDLFSGALSQPSHAAKQRSRQKTVTHMVFDRQRLTEKTQRTEVMAPRPRPKPVAAPDSHLPGFERVRQLLAGSRVQKKGKIVSGTPETQVEDIIRFLEEHDIMLTSTHGEHSE